MLDEIAKEKERERAIDHQCLLPTRYLASPRCSEDVGRAASGFYPRANREFNGPSGRRGMLDAVKSETDHADSGISVTVHPDTRGKTRCV